ncbi:MAG: hypothetical protein HW390_546 [Candidatus Brocadiaceae bacterium]|nr:hypothetical protein [Candidatus Brocadiaceae bacterium]
MFGLHGQAPLVHADTECVAANTYSPHSAIQNPQSPLRGVALKEHLVGAKIGGITGEQPAVTTVNYFTGNDKSKWKANVPTFNVVSLGEVYKGIELSLKAYGNNVEKLFCVKPGASPEFIKVQVDGSKSLRVNQEGQLEADTELGLVKFTRPIAYQEIEGKRVEVDVEYRLSNQKSTNSDSKNPKSEYGFTVASYDKTKDLIIDPLHASTFLGGSGDERGYSLALDTSGSVYVTGWTWSTDFPTTSGAYDTSYNGADVFVSKLNSGLTSLLASTYLGGSGFDLGYSLSLDTSGNVYVAGLTSSADFPTTSGAYDTSYNGYDVFVSKLNSGLTSLLASTYLGGSSADVGYSLSLDTSGNVYVTGETESTDFPATSGAHDTSYNGGDRDVFVSKLNSGLTSLLASTYLGGSSDDMGYSLALDTSGNVYVTGLTRSTNFQTTTGAYDTSYTGGYSDVFVSKLNSGLTSLLESTFLGGSDYDSGASLTLDTSGNVYVTGITWSTDFPTASGAYDTSNGGDGDVFVSKLNSGLTSLLASTYLGGSGLDGGAIGGVVLSLVLDTSLDTSGNVYVTGGTSSADFPTTSGAYERASNGYSDAFVSKFGSTLSAFSISPTSKSFSSEGGTGIVVVTAVSNSLVWTAVSNVTWITVTTGGTGSGEAAYSVSANTDSARTGTMTIAGETFTVRQYGGCAYTISPTSQSFTSGGGTGSVSVEVKLGSCSWTAKSNASWITVTSGGSGTGNGTVTYSVLANPGTNVRIGTITIAKNSFVVRQDGACAYTISPTSKSFTSGGGTGSVSVGVKSSNCSWTAVSNATWITVTSGGSGTGNGRVVYSVSANTGTSARTGTMTIAGKTFTVKQAK